MYLYAAKTGFGIIICPQTTAPAGKKGKLVTLGSRKELDCLVQFINDEFGEPAFEVKTIKLSKYKDMREGFSNIYYNQTHSVRFSDRFFQLTTIFL